MCKCDNCKAVFDADDVIVEKESRGEYWGVSAYEDNSYCPYCHNDNIDWDYEEGEDGEL